MIYNFKSESLNQENFDQDNLINSPPPLLLGSRSENSGELVGIR